MECRVHTGNVVQVLHHAVLEAETVIPTKIAKEIYSAARTTVKTITP